PFYYNPAPDGAVIWEKPVAVLTNRSTFSAANNFVSIMKQLPQVIIVGAATGGGSGMPFSSELPNGWGIRFSACSVLDAQGNPTEWGVDPSQGCAVDMDPQAALNGHDTILDHAIATLLR
ncbi:MAG: peptidase S41, partial [Muribaculaceae bacterium]|nr:peptidase S41 [Muribaculaceae bacterium]